MPQDAEVPFDIIGRALVTMGRHQHRGRLFVDAGPERALAADNVRAVFGVHSSPAASGALFPRDFTR